MELHFASVWEAIADLVPERDALVHGGRRVSWRRYDQEAARLAATLSDHGLGRDSKVGLYLYNGPEYLLAQHAAFKIRAVPVNVNYRYLDDELAYLLDNSDSEVLFFHSSLGDRVARVRERLPKLKAVIEVADDASHLPGALAYDEAAANPAPFPRIERPGRDLYMLYTGGTTGMPKGVMYRHDLFMAGLLEQHAATVGLEVPTSVEEIPALVRAVEAQGGVVSVPTCPLMHGTGMWVGAMRALVVGGSVVTLTGRSFDPDELWRTVERERVSTIVIVGDGFARPMLRALEEAESRGEGYELGSVKGIISSGAMWSAQVKDGLLARIDAVLADGLGSTEGGGYGLSVSSRAQPGTTATFSLGPATKVLSEDGREIPPGTGEPGLLASRTAAYGYFKDAERTAQTFRMVGGAPYVITGDWATVEADGTIRLLGRGNQCINSGGEKVFPEEVEEAIKRHPAVEDCLVVGLPDERFGQQVVAVACLRGDAVDGEGLREWLRDQISHYKIPRRFVLVDQVRRTPNGKADYPWARQAAQAALGAPAP